jgi:hypothetical protein
MTNAGQAFLLTAEVFCLSFFGIFLFWFADRLRGGSARKPRGREPLLIEVKPPGTKSD